MTIEKNLFDAAKFDSVYLTKLYDDQIWKKINFKLEKSEEKKAYDKKSNNWFSEEILGGPMLFSLFTIQSNQT